MIGALLQVRVTSTTVHLLNSKIENAHWAEKNDHNALWH